MFSDFLNLGSNQSLVSYLAHLNGGLFDRKMSLVRPINSQKEINVYFLT